MVAHHLAIGGFFTPMMTQFLDHEPGALMVASALVFEASTPFVSARAVLSHLGLKKSMAYVCNGLAMMGVFFACRLLVFPGFYWAYSARRGLGFLEGLFRTPPMCACFMTLVALPQIYWFKMMLNGAVKVVQERNNNNNNEAEVENDKKTE